MKKIAVFGKSSYLGSNFCDYLKDNGGYDIDKINSRGEEWKDIDYCKYDAIYFTAGKAHVKATKENEAEYYFVNRDLPIAVANMAKEQGVKQFIFLSSLAVMGLDGTIGKECNVDSQTKENPKLAYGISKLEADAELQKLNDDEFKVVIVRPPMVYGANCKGNFARLESLSRKIGIFPNFQNQRSMIYVKNLDEFIKMCIDNEVSGIYYPQDRDYINTSDMYYTIREVYGRKTCHTRLFNWIIKLIGNKVGVCRKLFGNLTIDKSLSNAFDFAYAKYDLKQSIEDIEINK